MFIRYDSIMYITCQWFNLEYLYLPAVLPGTVSWCSNLMLSFQSKIYKANKYQALQHPTLLFKNVM